MSSELDKRRRTHGDQFAARLLEKVDTDENTREPFDESRPRSREDIMLDVRLNDGHRKGFSYSYLVTVEYEPKDVIQVEFATGVVRIEGRRLVRLYDSLLQHRARYVQEGNESEDGLKLEESAHIDAITIEEKS